MKKAKKALSMFLALSLLLTSVQVPAFAAQPGGEVVEVVEAPEADAASAEVSAGSARDDKASEANVDSAGPSESVGESTKAANTEDPEEAANAGAAVKEVDADEPGEAAFVGTNAGEAANAADAGEPQKAADTAEPSTDKKPAEQTFAEENSENANEEAESSKPETAAGVTLLEGENWLEAQTLGSDVALEGNYVFKEGYLDLNGHTLTISGYLLQTGGVIDVNGGKLLVAGDYRLQNRSEDGTTFSSCGGALAMAHENSYVKVGGVFYASGDYGYYNRERKWFDEPLTQGTLEIGRGLYQSMRSDSFKSSGAHKVLLAGAGADKKVTVTFKDADSYIGTLEMAEGADILWEGYFNVGTLGNDVELSTSDEEGKAFRFRSADARMNFNGHNLTVNGDVDDLYGELYVGGAYNAGEAFDPAKAGSLTVNGNFLMGDGDLHVDGGEVTVTGDLRIQKQSGDGNYATSDAALVMVNESDRAYVGGTLYVDGDYGYYDQSRTWHKEMMTAGTLTIGKGLRQSGRTDGFNASGAHKTVLAGAGTGKKVSVSFAHANSNLGILEMAEGADISWEGCFNVQKLGSDVTVKTSSEENGGIVIYSENSRMSFNGHCLTVGGNVKDLRGSLYVGGAALLAEAFVPANAGSLVIDGTFLHQSGDLIVDGGSVTVTGDWRNQHLNDDGTYGNCDGALVMTNENDRVSVGGMFYASGDYGYYDPDRVWQTSMLTAGTLTLGKGLHQSMRTDSFKAKDDHKIILAGDGKDKKASVSFESEDSYLGILKMAEGAEISWEGCFNVQTLGNDVTVKTDTAKNEGITIYSKDARMNFNSHCLTVQGNVKDLRGSLYVGGATLLEDAFDAAKAGSLVIDGDFLHQTGDIIADGGSITVKGDWRNQHLNDDGTYGNCDGALVMINENDRVSVGGMFYASGDYGYYAPGRVWQTDMLTAGTLTLGKGLRQSMRSDSFKAKDAHRTILAGGEDRKVTVSFENSDSYLGILEMAEGAEISWEGRFNVQALGSDVTIHTSSTKNDGIEIYSANDRMDFCGHTLTVDGNVKDIHGSLYVGGEHLARENQEPNVYGSFVVNGDFLHQSGDLIVDCGKVTVTGDWRNQYLRDDDTYGNCDGALVMLHDQDSVNIGGDFYVSGDYGYYDLAHEWKKDKLTAGTLTVDGNFFQSMRTDAFCASGTHKTIIGGKAVQLADKDSYFATLELTHAPSEYIFSRVPCWSKLVYDGKELSEDDIAFAALFDETANTLTITKWADISAEIEIPETINGAAVTAIGDRVFENRKDLKKVTLPDTVIRIGEYAFSGCANLEEIALPASLETIERCAFLNCKALTELHFPAGLTTIGSEAFRSCEGLLAVALPAALQTIDDNAFNGCVNLPALAIPASVVTIENRAFRDCAAVETLAFAKSSQLEFIGSEAFEGLGLITEVVIPDGTKTIDSYAFSGCTSLKHVVVPASVEEMRERIFGGTLLTTAGRIGSGCDYEFGWTETIPGYAFDSLENLVAAEIPATVTEIGEYAYRHCVSLPEVKLPAGLAKMGRSAFSECNSFTKVELPENLSEIHEYGFYECANLEEAVFLGKSPITELPTGFFEKCRKLKAIDIPAGVTKIQSHAFSECETLTEVTIPAAVTDIGVNAFLNCKKLAKVNFAEDGALTTIHASAFAEDPALTVFTIPESVTMLGNNIFYNCKNLAKVTVPASIVTMESQVFRGTALKSSGPIGSGADYEFGWTETIPDYAFDYITELTRVELPDTVTAIGKNAFSECHSLETLILPKGLKTLGREVFNQCRSLTAIEIPEGVEVLPDCAFRGCESLEDVLLYGNLKEIKEAVFENCKALERLEIPDGVETIRWRAVNGCNSLLDLIVPESVATIENDAIEKTENLVMFVTPDSAAQAYAEEKEIPFEYMANLGRTVTANVTAPDGEALAGGFIVKWYNADTNAFLGTGRKLRNVAEGTKILCRVVLDEALGCVYVQPDDAAYTSTDKDGSIDIKLVPFEAAKISGTVKDAEGNALAGAVVKVKQTFNGIYEKMLTAVSDENGAFSFDAWKTQTVVAAAKDGYYDDLAALSAADLASGATKAELVLEKIPEDKITLNITVQKAAKAGETPVMEELSAAANLTFSVYNKTRGKALARDTEFRVQYPFVTLRGDAAAAGDELVLSVTDADGKLADGEKEVKLDENRCAAVDWTVVENGNIWTINIRKGEKGARAMIFDAEGICRENGSTGGSYQTGALPEGAYTLVFMEKSSLLASVDAYGRFAEMGLAEGTDFVKKTANVVPGVVTVVDGAQVPAFDESKLYYTVADTTRVTANAAKAVTGQYVTARVQFEIDSKYTSSGETLKIEMPAGMSFVERSLTLNGKAAACTVTDNADGTTSAAVPVNAKSGTIRFYVLPREAGTKKFHAYLSFQKDGGAVTQPIGEAAIEVSNATIKVPAQTGFTTVTATGKAPAGCEVTIYDNGTEAGKTTSKKNGSWSLDFDLVNPQNYSYHEIYASIESEDYGHIDTDTAKVMYNKQYIEVSKVTMINTAHLDKTCEFVTVFDFLHPASSVPSYNYWPAYPTFTFIVEFTGGDEEVLSDVRVATRNSAGDLTYVPCTYDAAGRKWIGTHDYMTFQEVPVSVGVLCTNTSGDTIDMSLDLEATAKSLSTAKILSDKALAMVSDRADTEDVVIGDEAVSFDLTLGGEKVGSYKAEVLDYATFDLSDWEDYVEYEEEDGTVSYQATAFEDDSYVVYEAHPADRLLVKTSVTFTAEAAENLGGAAAELLEALAGAMNGDAEAMAGFRIFSNVDNWIKTIDTVREICSDFGDLLEDLSGIKEYSDLMEDFVKLYYYVPALRDIIENLLKPAMARKNCPGVDTSGFGKMIEDLENEINSYRNKSFLLLGGMLAANALMDYAGGKVLKFAGKAGAKGVKELYKYIMRRFGKRMSRPVKKLVKKGVQIAGEEAESYMEDQWGNLTDYITGFFDVRAHVENGYQELDKKIRDKVKEIAAIKCEKEITDEPNEEEPATPIADPSGYVYEAVPSNRLSGVVATIYEYTYEVDEFGVPAEEKSEILWDAAAYDQVNPQTTGESGTFGWDVPEGQWLVKFTKDGYEDADSHKDVAVDKDGYLPVPPIQTEVNTAMVSKAVPAVANAAAYPTEVQFDFTQYMQIDTVNTANVTVAANGKAVAGTITALNAEDNYEGTTQYASSFAFRPSQELSGAVTIRVSGAKNYNGKAMTAAFEKTETVVPMPKSLSITGATALAHHETAELTVKVLPAEAGANRTITVITYSPSILSAAAETITTDANGVAKVTLSGNLPGQGILGILLDGTQLSEEVVRTVAAAGEEPMVKDLAELGYEIVLDQETFTYDGTEQQPAVMIGDLVLGTDFTVAYENNINAGTAKVTATGIGNYTGTLTKEFTILPADLAEASVEELPEAEYTGETFEPVPVVTFAGKELVSERDYEVDYEDNTNAGEAKVVLTGKGNYTGTKTATFAINKAAQAIACKVSAVAVGEKAAFAVTGGKGAKFTVTSSSKAILKVTKTVQSSKKFQVQGVKVGTAKLTIKVASTDNYALGKITVTVKVVPAATTKIQVTNLAKGQKVAWAKVTGATSYLVYCGSTLIKEVTTNSLSYAKANTNGKKYVYKVVAKASTGTSTLSKSLTTYRLAATAFTTVKKNAAAGTISLKWKKNAKATGYEVQYSTTKTFKKVKTLTVKGAGTVTQKITKLTKGKTYYVRVRAIKTVGKTTYASAWSTAA